LAIQDKTIVCRDCGKDFTWTASEQEFYQSKGFENEPVRCPSCRALKKARMGNGTYQKVTSEITCSECGKTDTVPFKPRGDRPVLCRDCFRKQRPAGA
jgi:CxxC-x17-CxxC domain-containing protein